jgi:hypothetical protein
MFTKCIEDIRKTETLRRELHKELKNGGENALQIALELIELYSSEKFIIKGDF